MFPTVVQVHDDDLEHRILEFLQVRGVADLANIRVKVSGGVATVRGRLSSSHEKQVFLECCRHVAGVVRVVEQTKVNASPAHTACPDIAPTSEDIPRNWFDWT